jgi:hypothetical protein
MATPSLECPNTGRFCEGREFIAVLQQQSAVALAHVEIEDSFLPPNSPIEAFIPNPAKLQAQVRIREAREQIVSIQDKAGEVMTSDTVTCDGSACGALTSLVLSLASSQYFEIRKQYGEGEVAD